MRPPKTSLVAVLSVFLLLSCLVGSVAGFARQQRPGRFQVVRSDRFIEARQPDDDYGPPPPYYTVEPAVRASMASYSTSQVTSATVTSEPHASSGNYTFSRGIPSLSESSELDTSTLVPSAASSVKASSGTSSEALTAAGTTTKSSHLTQASGNGISETTDGHVSTIRNTSSSPIRTGSSVVTSRASDSASMTGTVSLETELSSSNAESESLSEVFSSASPQENSRVTSLTTTTTEVINITVTVTGVIESTASLVASQSLNGTVSVTITTYLTSTLDTTRSTDIPNPSSATESSNLFTSTLTLSESLGQSESDITTISIQASSGPLVASSALAINATSNSVMDSLKTTTVSEPSPITMVPGVVPPMGNVTGMTTRSVSTDYSKSTASPSNSSMTRGEETSSVFDWSTSTVAESRSSPATIGLPSISFTSFSFSIITTPMTPPSVATGSVSPPFENVTVIRSTWTSTITTSLGPTGFTSSAAHSTSGYNFSKTLESEMSSVGSWQTSANNLTDISTSIITRQPTNLPFPINTTSEWKPTVSSVTPTESTKTVSSQSPQASMSTPGSGWNTTAPYANSTSATGSASYSLTFGSVSYSRMGVTTYRSWNTTNTVQGPVNSTIQTATFGTQTEASMSGATGSLNRTVTAIPPFPTNVNVTLTTISGTVITETYTDILVSIITPTDSIFWSSSTVSSSFNTTPLFPFPSNTTLAGTGTHPTVISSSGEFSTPYKVSTTASERKYHTSNATQHMSVSIPLGSASGTGTPKFPSSNLTATATITFSSIVSWTPDPSPWTTWSTWDLTGKSGASISKGLPRVTIGNLSSVVSESTSYTRTTTLLLTTTLAEPSTSQSKFQNSTGDASSSISYTSTTTLFLTTTLEKPSTSRLSGATITSTASPWMNTTLVSTHSPEASTFWSEVTGTFLTTGSAKGIFTSAENSTLAPFPMTNSTLSQPTSSAIGTLTTTHTPDRPSGVTTPCKSSSTASSTCTDSVDYLPQRSSSVDSFTTDCWTASGSIDSSRPYVPTTPGQVSTICNTTSSMTSYSTARWSNTTKTFGIKDTSTYGSLTTFKTVTTVRAEESVSLWDDYPTPTDRVTSSEALPENPNFTSGNDFPAHRHKDVPNVGISVDNGGVSKSGYWRRQWENAKDKIQSVWHGKTLETEG
ncbi:muc1-extracellular alpha-1,4-glucan glucosidase [Fusarium longipes]|uniref:Muc1-extracellular alpha-1,4-glucan glucosidase n=1 Tax=Fusarium longipes TaxID=694270 RepID=A0A395SZJ9_9HYPO|nr:muc1-extracellular alpha-1,4-glucan glucosidase [Fusarium longipes]